jgi:hypothetical protein
VPIRIGIVWERLPEVAADLLAYCARGIVAEGYEVEQWGGDRLNVEPVRVLRRAAHSARMPIPGRLEYPWYATSCRTAAEREALDVARPRITILQSFGSPRQAGKARAGKGAAAIGGGRAGAPATVGDLSR